VLDLMTSPEELTKARTFFDTEQKKYDSYKPLLTATDAPAIHVNDDYMRTYRPLMEPYYYDASKYPSYLDQLGIKYPNPPTGPVRKIVPPKSFGGDTASGG
jgi:aminobenzoyl-glutamate utilization protein B